MKHLFRFAVVVWTVFSSRAYAQTWVNPWNGGIVQCLAASGTYLFAGTYSNGVYRSSDNGTNWTAFNSGLPTNSSVYALCISGTNLFAGTGGAGVFLSTDNGDNWTAANGSPPNNLTTLYVLAFAVSDPYLFAGTNGGGVFRSTNNGTSWTAVNTGLTGTYSSYVLSLFVSGTNLFAGTSGSGIYLSTNNGDSWAQRSSGLSYPYVRAFAFSDPNLFAGTSGGVYLSTNNGANWTAFNTGGPAPFNVYAFAVSGTNLFAGTLGAGVYTSPISAANWTAVNSGLTGYGGYVFALLATSTDLFAGTQGGIYYLALPLPIQMASFTASLVRDRDVEVAWRTLSETNNYGFEICRRRGESGEWKKIAFVNGHGTTLVPQSYTYVDHAVSFGNYYYCIRQIDLDGKSEIFPAMEVSVGVVPGSMVLAQNYPNPFNPTTTIDFTVPLKSFVTLKVYNVLGQEIATVFEGNVDGGKVYTTPFDASAFSSGIYFYRLHAGSFVETKKMLLVR
jgi:photosystem II stability/assembly factor-like uncharacterized protein